MKTSKYIKEPFYNMGFKEGVIAERQRIKLEIKKIQLRHIKMCEESSLGYDEADIEYAFDEVLALLNGDSNV